MMKLNYESYDTPEEKTIDFATVKEIQDVSFSYDGGRLTIMVNGKIAYTTFTAGNDCFVGIAVNSQ